jgi:hypothetical protein
MKQSKYSKEAEAILNSIDDRLGELWEKLTTGNYNEATQYAFDIGFVSDIDNCLKKLKLKRTFKKFKSKK